MFRIGLAVRNVPPELPQAGCAYRDEQRRDRFNPRSEICEAGANEVRAWQAIVVDHDGWIIREPFGRSARLNGRRVR